MLVTNSTKEIDRNRNTGAQADPEIFDRRGLESREDHV